jgi:hypothetical protein
MKLLYLEWADAVTATPHWRTKDEALDWADNEENYLVKSFGWLLKETKGYILICDYWAGQTEDTEEQVDFIHRIPKTWIKKRKEIKI